MNTIQISDKKICPSYHFWVTQKKINIALNCELMVLDALSYRGETLIVGSIKKTEKPGVRLMHVTGITEKTNFYEVNIL